MESDDADLKGAFAVLASDPQLQILEPSIRTDATRLWNCTRLWTALTRHIRLLPRQVDTPVHPADRVTENDNKTRMKFRPNLGECRYITISGRNVLELD